MRRLVATVMIAGLAGGCGLVGFDLGGPDAAQGPLRLTAARTWINLSSELATRAEGGTPPYRYATTGGATVSAEGVVLALDRAGAITVTVTDAVGATADLALTSGGDALFVLGGATPAVTSSVLRTTDGRTWTASGDLPAARRSGRAIVFRDRIYYLGGENPPVFFDQVWSSADGATWDQVGTLPVPMASFGLTVVAGELWIVGGYTVGSRNSRVVAHSPDGVTWTLGPELPDPGLHAGGAFSVGTTLYLAGGHGAGFLDGIHALGPGATTWAYHPGRLPATADWGVAGVRGDRNYYAVEGGVMMSADPLAPAWASVLDLPPGGLEPGLIDFRGEFMVIGGDTTRIASDGDTFTTVPGLPGGRDHATFVQFTPP